jgi:tetratricopeptide (TPR) repeat protein
VRRLLLWLVLVGFFLVAYVLAGKLPEALRVRFVTSWFPFAMFALFFAVFVLFFSWARAANRLSVEGNSLLAQGRFVEAIAMFERAAKLARRSNVLPYYRGVALLCLWRVAEAEASFAEAASQRLATADLTKLLFPSRSLTAALLGKDDLARERLAEAERIGAGATAEALLARAVLAVRARRWSDARELLQRYEVKLLGGPMRGLADALYAWCVEQSSGELRPVDRVGLFGEAGPESLKRLWPDFTDFVARAPRP